jgi:hypothetical protein
MAGEEGVAEVSVYEATGALIRMLSSDEVRMRGDRCSRDCRVILTDD